MGKLTGSHFDAYSQASAQPLMPAVNFNQVVRASSFTSPQSLAATSQLTIVFDMLEVSRLVPVDATMES